MNRIDSAIQLAVQAHFGQKDKIGQPVILHPLTILITVQPATESNQIVAVLHDVLEDTVYSIGQIMEHVSLTDHEIEALNLLNHKRGDPYVNYVQRIKMSGNDIALSVKLADIKHNAIRGHESLPKDVSERLKKKYENAMLILTEI